MTILKSVIFTLSKKLNSLIQSYKNRKFILIELGGNFGDDIIFKGARKLFDALQIDYESYYYEEFLKKEWHQEEYIFYVHGGFGFNSLWNSGVVACFHKILRKNLGDLIIGPQTYIQDKPFIQENLVDYFNNTNFDYKVFIFTRELMSYEFLKDFIPSRIELDHDHDTALNLIKDDFDCEVSQLKNLYVIRNDAEGLDFQKYNPLLLWFDPIRSCTYFDNWVAMHAQAKKIFSNRLHSAIFGLILGKKIYILPNKYNKNRSIWEYSLANRGVKWLDELPASNIEKFLMKNKFYISLCSSYKINAIQRVLYGCA